MKIKLILYIIILLAFCINPAFGQIYWPFTSYTSNDYSLAYGDRDRSTSGYDYDFHAAIDIAVPENTEVYAVCSGVVKGMYTFGELRLV